MTLKVTAFQKKLLKIEEKISIIDSFRFEDFCGGLKIAFLKYQRLKKFFVQEIDYLHRIRIPLDVFKQLAANKPNFLRF